MMPAAGGGAALLASPGLEWECAEEEMLLSFAVTQWRTTTEKRTSNDFG